MARLERHGLGGAVALAASLLFAMAPVVSFAGPPGSHGSGEHFGGGHYDGRGGAGGRGPMHLAEGPQHRFEGPHGGPHYEGPHGGPHYGGPHYGGPHFVGHPRYAVPSHWVGMHPHWGGPGPHGAWVRPWGPRWVPHRWGGGYWGGRFWPHVYLGWDFPWFLAALPVGYTTYYWGGIPYYYTQGVYYAWNPDYGQYVVTDPPPVSGGTPEGAAPPPDAQEAAGADPAAGDARGAMSLFVYPKKGQSQQQTDSDRFQCHQWAVGQTGFDPTNTANNTAADTATPANYKRAVTACLEARGYSVR